jgi:hypothetical protein
LGKFTLFTRPIWDGINTPASEAAREITTEILQSEVTKRAETTRNAVIIALALSLAALVSSNKCNTNETSSETVPSASANPNAPKHFEFGTYTPPEAGIIVKKESFPEAEKTIVFISDVHAQKAEPFASANAKQLELTGGHTQRQIFTIIEEAIRNYGQIPVVLESWTDYGPETFNRNVFQEGHGIKQLAAITPPLTRIAAAHNLIGKPQIGAGPLLAATYQQEIIPITSQSPQQMQTYTEIAETYESLIATYTETGARCSNIPFVTAEKTIPMADQKFSSGERNADTLQCYCTFQILEKELTTAFETARRVTAAETEAKKAIANPGNFAFIIAGAGHTAGVIKTTKAAKQNIIVVAPRAAEQETRAAIYNAPPAPLSKDDANGTCATWSEKKPNREQLDKTRTGIAQEIHQRYVQINAAIEQSYENSKH